MMFKRLRLRHLGIEYSGSLGSTGWAWRELSSSFRTSMCQEKQGRSGLLWLKLVDMSKQGSEEAAGASGGGSGPFH